MSQNQPRYKQSHQQQEKDLSTQLNADSTTFFAYAKAKLDWAMADKLWRLDISSKMETFTRNRNSDLREDLDLRHSRQDIKFFSLRKATYLEEDIFKYFYPFCLVNCTVGAGIIFKSTPWLAGCAAVFTAEYVYFLFAFPVEAWHFHKRALSTSKPYA